MIPLGLVLQELLEARRYSQAEFAHRCGRGVVCIPRRIALRLGEPSLRSPNDLVAVRILEQKLFQIGTDGLLVHLLVSRVQRRAYLPQTKASYLSST